MFPSNDDETNDDENNESLSGTLWGSMPKLSDDMDGVISVGDTLSGTTWVGSDLESNDIITVKFQEKLFSFVISKKNSEVVSTVEGSYFYRDSIVFLLEESEIVLLKMKGTCLRFLDQETGKDMGINCVKQYLDKN